MSDGQYREGDASKVIILRHDGDAWVPSDDLEVIRDKHAPVTPYTRTVVGTPETVATPAAGNAFRLRWYYVHADPDNGDDILFTLKLGSTVVFRDSLDPGQPMAHGTHIVGAANQTVNIEQSSTGTFYVVVEVEEFTP